MSTDSTQKLTLSEQAELGAGDIVYLATPYSSDSKYTEEYRYKIVTKISAVLVKDGVINFSPITQSHEQHRAMDLPGSWNFWSFVDTAFLNRCDQLWVLTLPGWTQSVGVAAEIELAKEFGLPIKFITPGLGVESVLFVTEEQARKDDKPR